MSEVLEVEPTASPVEGLEAALNERQAELAYLRQAFVESMELVSDIDRVNAVIAASSRPDLVITECVAMMPWDDPKADGNINNFWPTMESFGVAVIEDREDWAGKVKPTYLGRRQFTDEEFDQVLFLGGLDYAETTALAKAHGINPDFAQDLVMNAQIGHEAILRMLIVFPELSRYLRDRCLETPERLEARNKTPVEEVFVAYNLATRLIDKNDRGAIKADGTVDTWLLCH